MNEKPILLVGFPRSFTSAIYRIMADAMNMDRPLASSGEVLNWQRWPENCPQSLQNMGFFSRLPENYPGVSEVYNSIAESGKKYLIKDVVQPFQTLRYLQENPGKFQVFYIRRDLRAVVHSLRKRGWFYVHSMELLDQEFMKFPFIEVSRVMHDPTYLVRRMRSFGYAMRDFDYLTPDFIEKRNRILDALEQDHPLAELAPEESWPLLKSGRRYVFGHPYRRGPSPALLADGWSADAELGAWTDGRLARLAMTLAPMPDGGQLRLELGGNGYFENKVHISATCAGTPLEAREITLAASAEETTVLHVPPAPGPRPLLVTFQAKRTAIPALMSDKPSLAAEGVRLLAMRLKA